jgi:hypothetical protein
MNIATHLSTGGGRAAIVRQSAPHQGEALVLEFGRLMFWQCPHRGEGYA